MDFHENKIMIFLIAKLLELSLNHPAMCSDSNGTVQSPGLAEVSALYVVEER